MHETRLMLIHNKLIRVRLFCGSNDNNESPRCAFEKGHGFSVLCMLFLNRNSINEVERWLSPVLNYDR